MHTLKKTSVERLMLIGFGMTLAVLLLVGGIALNDAVPSVAAFIGASIVLLLAFLALLTVRIRRVIRGRLESNRHCKRCGSHC